MKTMARSVLPMVAARPRYSIRCARSRADIEAALRLRYEVFNLELNEGLAASHATAMDEDEFDAVCDHLLVTNDVTGEVVGTYRMQTGTSAKANLGYYSEREFDFSLYESLRSRILELGRACVHRDHRTITVVSMLWRGIVEYAAAHGARYLVGCSSLTSQDPALGWAMYSKISRKHLVAPALRTVPLPVHKMSISPEVSPCPQPPKLLRAYLSVGAKICGPPAIDREFGTIDFLTWLDCETAPISAVNHFVHRRRVE